MRGIKKVFNTFIAVILSLFTVISSVSPIYAAQSETGSITVSFIEGATFSSALVATEGNGEFIWIDSIKNNPNFKFSTTDMFDKTQYEKISKELVNITNSLNNIKAEITDKEGKCTFNNLEKGIYLVWQTKNEGASSEYEISLPCLVEIPDRSVNPSNFNVTVYPKANKITKKLISITGIKHWEDEDEKTRPSSILLRLYANDIEVAQTTTDKSKDWAFSFNEINALDENGKEITFSIKEDKVNGYVFSQDEVLKGENTIVINVTNTLHKDGPNTGDNSNVILWISIICGALVVIIISTVVLFKKNKK